MLFVHISFAVGLIALVAGVSLYLWSVRAELGPGVTLAKVIGIVVLVLSILQLVCTAYTGIRFGKFQKEVRSYMDSESRPVAKDMNSNAHSDDPSDQQQALEGDDQAATTPTSSEAPESTPEATPSQ